MAHAEQIMRNFLQTIAAEQKFTDYDLKFTPISTGGANFTAHLFTATITEGRNEINVFGKVAAIGEKMRGPFHKLAYVNEIFFYTNLAKVYHQLEEKNGVPAEYKIKIPQFYGCTDTLYEETIVMENLTAKGYNAFDRFKSVDWDYAASAITEMAKFHALSVAYQVTEPEVYKGIAEKLMIEMPGDDVVMTSLWDKIANQALDATKEENKDKLKVFFNKTGMGRETYMKLREAEKLAVIAHGGCRPSNFMHRVLEDGSIEVILVDYQTIQTGSPIADLLYFIFTGTDAEFRKNYYKKLVEHYYSELRAAMTRLGLNPDEKYSRNDFEFELKKKLPFGLAVAVLMLPIVTVEAEDAPNMNAEELSDFGIQKTGSLYPERLNGVVDDFVRWGVI